MDITCFDEEWIVMLLTYPGLDPDILSPASVAV
jgi:hypothetical protein